MSQLTPEEIEARAESKVRVPAPGEAGKHCLGGLSGCGRWLSLDSFHANRRAPDGKKRRCKSCMARYQLSNPAVMQRAQDLRSEKAGRLRRVPSRRAAAIVADFLGTGRMPDGRDPRLTALLDEFLNRGRG